MSIVHTKILKERLQNELDQFSELEASLSDPAVSSDPAIFRELSRKHARLQGRIEPIRNYLNMLAELEEAESLLRNSDDPELKEMAEQEKARLDQAITRSSAEMEEYLIPPDPKEGRPVIIEIRAGTGGEEAALFVADLYKMYMLFAEKEGLNIDVISASPTELGGYKEVIFSVNGEMAYRWLHQEGGTHRVQRIPSTESGGRIHTSAVTVAVMPELEEEEFVIEDKDIRIDVFRASGAGGQHVNKTESAVRLTHIPTGIVVSCQDERSQLKNRAKAMKVLRARLAEMQEEQRHAEEARTKKEQVKSGDRSERIRTYNFPQGRITDHRIGFTAYNLTEFMAGNIYDLLNALIEHEKQMKIGPQN